MGARWGLSSWAACTSFVAWGDSLRQEHAPPASAAHRQVPTAWSPASQDSDVKCKQLSPLRALRGRRRGGCTGRGCVGGVRFTWIFSSTSLLVSATRVSHGIQGHQLFIKHAAKSEIWCPPGQRAGTLNRSSAAHKNNSKAKPNQNKAKEKEKSFNCWVRSLSVQLLFFCLRQKIKKSIRVLFGREGKK